MNNNKWVVDIPAPTFSSAKPPVKSVKMLAAQRQHVKKLQQKLEEDEKNFFMNLMSIDGWEYFITKHTSTYQRPKEVLPKLKNYFRGIDIEFDKEDGLPTSASFTIRYAAHSGYGAYQYCKFRTNPIPIEDIENFIQNKE